MQVYSNSNQEQVKRFLFFLLILVLAYLPVSSFLFFLKNDAFNGYFPPKFFMSESIHAGQLPLWNPYINFGIPQYGDMSSGYWSPITWLIASTVGYNAYSLTLEVLFYILIGGLGFYTLMQSWVDDKRVRMIAAVAYMCCGYHIGHLQHFNWLSGSAFLPWCLWSYLALFRSFSVKHTLLCAFYFYMLLASAHPGITISAGYFFIAVFIYQLFNRPADISLQGRLTTTGKAHLLLVIILLLLCAGMISGYFDLLPYFVRSEKISLESSLSDPTNVQSWISFILPFATVKNDALFQTDISVRNTYYGLTLYLFLLLAFTRKKDHTQTFFLFTGLLFLLLSTGGIFKTIAYKFIPLIGYVRLNGEFRIFAIFCFIIVSAIELNKYIKQERTFSGALKWLYYALELFLFAVITFAVYKALHLRDSFLYNTKSILAEAGLTGKLKALVDAVSFYDCIWIQGSMQMLFLWGIKYALREEQFNLLKNVFIINMILCSLLNIPFTGVGKSPVAQVQAVLNKSPKGIPTPALQPVISNDSLPVFEKGLVGDWSMYSKQIGVTKLVPYPVMLKNSAGYFEELENGNKHNFLNRPFIFISPFSEKDKTEIRSFTTGKIRVSAFTDSVKTLVLQQNYYPHWFYYNGKVKMPVQQAGKCFMGAPLTKGNNDITFRFEPTFVKWMMLLSAVSMLVLVTILLYLKIRSLFLSLQKQ